MLQQLFHFVLISIVCITWGLPVLLVTRHQKKSIIIGTGDFILSFFTGLCLISFFAAWICLWLPLNAGLLIPASALPLIFTIIVVNKKSVRFSGFFPYRRRKQTFIPILLFTTASIVLFFILGSNRPVMTDTGLYHLQIVRWNQEYGTVPGLANIYLRYGFYSNWLSVISLFVLPFKNENYLFLNLAASIWFLLFLIQKLSFFLVRYEDSNENRILSWTYALIVIFLFILWGLFRGNASSTSYDFIVSCLTLIVLLSITEELVSGSVAAVTGLIPLFIISASIPFFKLSGFAIIFIVPVYWLATKKSRLLYPAFALLLTAYAVPFLARNYIQTGYPLYPYTFISWGHPDWQVPLPMAERIARYISLTNKYFNQPIPPTDWAQPSYQWIKTWFIYIPTTDKLIVLLAAAGLPVLLLYARRRMARPAPLITICISCCLAAVLWFIASPDPRFAYGYLLFLAACPLSFFLAEFTTRKWIVCALSVLGGGIIIYGSSKFNVNNLVAPEKISVPPTSIVKINNADYHLPLRMDSDPDIRCYDSGLPCIYEINPYLERRSDHLKKGFRMKRDIDSVFIINYRY